MTHRGCPHLKSSPAPSSSGRRYRCWSLRCRCRDLNTGLDTWPWRSHSWLRPSPADSDTPRVCTPRGKNSWGLCSPLETEKEFIMYHKVHRQASQAVQSGSNMTFISTQIPGMYLIIKATRHIEVPHFSEENQILQMIITPYIRHLYLCP